MSVSVCACECVHVSSFDLRADPTVVTLSIAVRMAMLMPVAEATAIFGIRSPLR